MQKWEIFEQNASSFLNTLYPNFKFENIGSTDSNAPDIKAFDKEGKHLFNIEAKFSPAQAGQIVILNNGSTFEFSDKSMNKRINSTDSIIEYLNNNYNKYAEITQSAILIEVDSDHLYSFIEEQYNLKGNQWIIASSQASSLNPSSVCLIPTNELRYNFEVSASLRRKKSGTRDAPKKNRENIEKIISTICDKYAIETNGKKTILHGDIGSHPYELLDNLYLSKKGSNKYEIKVRSNTNNINVMFSLKLKDGYQFKSKEFSTYLNSFK